MFDHIKDQVRNAKKIVFVTGAGISEESGIPTFRGKDGYWKKCDPMKLATIDAFYLDPKLVWEWYEDRRKNILNAKPNLGHYAISQLAKYTDVVVLTQNIDGLHQRAGSGNVYELHGNIITVRCTACEYKQEHPSSFDRLPPLCQCGSILRPDVVWFGEPLPFHTWQQAINHAQSCDLMVIAGTSLVVSPANQLPLYAKQNGAKLIEINLEPTILTPQMDLSVRQSCAQALPQLVQLFDQ